LVALNLADIIFASVARHLDSEELAPTMNNPPLPPQKVSSARTDGLALGTLLGLFLLASCISVTMVMRISDPASPLFLWGAVGGTSLLLVFITLFLAARFSFGYLAGISFYSMIIGFVWLSYFTLSDYDHVRARWSAAASLLMFMLPLMFQTSWLRRPLVLSLQTMDRLMIAGLAVALVVILWGASYGYALVGIDEADGLRSAFARPTILNYATGAITGGVLPFAFAYFAWRHRYVLAAASILLMLFFYPIVLNKTVLFAIVWLPFLFILFKSFEPRRAAVLSVLIPTVAGVIGYRVALSGGIIGDLAFHVFGYVSRRMLAIPSLAMDRYSDFFASRELTHFCQIGFVRAIRGCPYAFQLGAEMATRYKMGNLNGSLFATEGIASVGPLWAPLSALVCGLILSIGNSVSARLPAPLIAASSGVAVQALINVPLSASLLSNGVFTLFLLWWITPDSCRKGPVKENKVAFLENPRVHPESETANSILWDQEPDPPPCERSGLLHTVKFRLPSFAGSDPVRRRNVPFPPRPH
jgi:hypothetical protein